MSAHLLEALEALCRSVGTAHHSAFADSDGHDPEWPLWYAEQMAVQLATLTQQTLTRSELVYLLVAAERARVRSGTDEPWPAFYARFFTDALRDGRPLGGATDTS